MPRRARGGVRLRRTSAGGDSFRAAPRRRETPQEQVRRWQRVIRGEMRAVERQIAGAPPARRVCARFCGVYARSPRVAPRV
jgi:hypothetical protein